jgi:hypothetical protein
MDFLTNDVPLDVPSSPGMVKSHVYMNGNLLCTVIPSYLPLSGTNVTMQYGHSRIRNTEYVSSMSECRPNLTVTLNDQFHISSTYDYSQHPG